MKKSRLKFSASLVEESFVFELERRSAEENGKTTMLRMQTDAAFRTHQLNHWPIMKRLKCFAVSSHSLSRSFLPSIRACYHTTVLLVACVCVAIYWAQLPITTINGTARVVANNKTLNSAQLRSSSSCSDSHALFARSPHSLHRYLFHFFADDSVFGLLALPHSSQETILHVPELADCLRRFSSALLWTPRNTCRQDRSGNKQFQSSVATLIALASFNRSLTTLSLHFSLFIRQNTFNHVFRAAAFVVVVCRETLELYVLLL